MLNHGAELDKMFHALADTTRRSLLERISSRPMPVSELAQPLDMSLSAVMQHLQLLEASGLVRSEKMGRIRTYRIEPAAINMVEQWLSERRSAWEHRFESLGDFLAENP